MQIIYIEGGHMSGHMKDKALTLIVAFILFVGVINVPCYALPDGQSSAIQSFLDEACHKTGIPGMALSVRVGEDVQYFSVGYADREKALRVNEDTLFQLASVSKAFTAFGILLLEERELLSMDDPIQKYLPWFTLQYKGIPVDMNSLTLNDFLHHTSGLTNSKHTGMLTINERADALSETVRAYINTNLAFSPGEKFEYGTMNYSVLGLVIAELSGQSYEDFMKTQVLEPLGLHETYMYEDEANSTGRLARGYVNSFLRVFPIESPRYDGDKPGGYIISCARDMARWTDIHLGLADDIPDVYRAVAEKSHNADTSVMATDGQYYAGGWIVDTEGKYIGHSGDSPNFSSDVRMYPQEHISIILLTNGNQANNQSITESIKSIIDGGSNQRHAIGIRLILDRIGVVMTIAGLLFAFLFLLLGLQRWKNRNGNRLSKKRILLITVWTIITAVIVTLGMVFPMIAGVSGWRPALEFANIYSTLTGFIALTLASVTIIWFVFARRK